MEVDLDIAAVGEKGGLLCLPGYSSFAGVSGSESFCARYWLEGSWFT